MIDRNDDIIQDVLVDSELAKQIVPNKFKHTSKQGRTRRQKLLLGARELCRTQDIASITLADVCKEAGIPRASAYHFFPNVHSIITALRFLNYLETYNAIKMVDVSKFNSWQDFITELLRLTVKMFNKDTTTAKLMYGANAPDIESNGYEERVDRQMVKMIITKLSERFETDNIDNIEEVFLIAYGITHSVFALSFRQNQVITEHMLNESITATLAYLNSRLPTKLALKK